MPTRYTARQGDCISSIAVAHGMLPDTLWNAPENEALRRDRRDPNALAPGDEVVIPDPDERVFEVATDATHAFVRKGIPQDFRLVLEDEDGEPRADLPYVVEIAGEDPIEGTTDGSGALTFPLRPSVTEAVLRLDLGEDREPEVHLLRFGCIDAIETVEGARQRLVNLGYACARTGELDDALRGTLREFQSDRELPITGELDDATKAALSERYGA